MIATNLNAGSSGPKAKLSGFSIIRNAVIMGYPILESIKSALPLVDEFVICVGQSDDSTVELLESIQSPKLRIVQTHWDTTKTRGGLILSEKTNEALDMCQNDWCLYLQADEVLHEQDLLSLQKALDRAEKNPSVEGLLFDYIHFYGSFNVIATSRKWYRKEIRIVRKSSGARSVGDAQSFKIDQTRKLSVLPAHARIFHYGWVKPPKLMGDKSRLLNRLWHGFKRDREFDHFDFERQYGLRQYVGTHPAVIQPLVENQGWEFDPSRRWSDWSLSDLNLFASDAIERVTGYRIGEYRPYRLLKGENSGK